MAEAALAAGGARWRLSAPRRLQIVTLLGLLAVWEIVSATGLVYRGVIPSWTAIAVAFFQLLGTNLFWFNLSVTLMEIGFALLIGSTMGAVVGVLLGSSRLVAAAFEPLINCVASTPKVVFLPLLYLFFGIGVGSKIAAGALSCFFPMVIGVTSAMLHINPVLVRVGKSFGITWPQMVRKIYLPAMKEPIGNGLRIAVGVSVGVCLIAETRFSYGGLGHLVIDSFNRSRFAQVYAVLVIVIALAVTLNALVGRLTRRSRS